MWQGKGTDNLEAVSIGGSFYMDSQNNPNTNSPHFK